MWSPPPPSRTTRRLQTSDRKLKKQNGDLTLTLRRTPDVLAALGAQKRPGQTLVGFALETHDGEDNARGKLAAQESGLDRAQLGLDAGRGLRDRHQPPHAARGRRPARRGPERVQARLSPRRSWTPSRAPRRSAPRAASAPARHRLHVRRRPRFPSTIRHLARCAFSRSATRTPSARASRRPTAGRSRSRRRSAQTASTWATRQIVATTGWTVAELDAGITEARLDEPFDARVAAHRRQRSVPRRDAPRRTGPRSAPCSRRAVGFAGGDARRVVVVATPDWGVTPFGASSGRGPRPRRDRARDRRVQRRRARRDRGGRSALGGRVGRVAPVRRARRRPRTACIRRARSTRAGPNSRARPSQCGTGRIVARSSSVFSEVAGRARYIGRPSPLPPVTDETPSAAESLRAARAVLALQTRISGRIRHLAAPSASASRRAPSSTTRCAPRRRSAPRRARCRQRPRRQSRPNRSPRPQSQMRAPPAVVPEAPPADSPTAEAPAAGPYTPPSLLSTEPSADDDPPPPSAFRPLIPCPTFLAPCPTRARTKASRRTSASRRSSPRTRRCTA